MPHVHQDRCDELDDASKEYDENFDDQSDDEDSSDERQSQRAQQPILQMLDDDVIFGFIKKLACTAFRQLITSAIGPGGLDTNVTNGGNTTSCGTIDARVTGTRLNANYFSDIVQSLTPQKRKVIETYGFQSLLLFEKCTIPLPFASWIADHIQVTSSDIVVRNRSIPISAHIVWDVLGIPFGGRPIKKSDSEKGKRDFLGVLELNSLPTVKSFGDKIMKGDISDDDDLVRSFLIVALATFLCPNSSSYPSTEYLLPLVLVKSAKKWDWSKFVHCWLMKQMRKYQNCKKKPLHHTRTLGGCLYFICVNYLDFLSFGPHDQLPSTLPHITVWKHDMIKRFSELDRLDGTVFGKRPILPLKSTCYALKAAARTPSPTCILDGSNFKKVLLERVPGSFSPQTLDDVSAIYMKHASEHKESVNNGEATGSKCARNNEVHGTGVPTQNDHAYNDDVLNDGVFHLDEAEEGGQSVIAPMPAICDPITDLPREDAPDVPCSTPALHSNHTIPAHHDNVVTNEQASANTDCNRHAANVEPPSAYQDNLITSGDTEIVPSSGGDTQSQHLSLAETEKISSSSPDVSNSSVLSQGNKRRLSDSVTDDVDNSMTDSIAGLSRARHNSMSPRVPLKEIEILDNCEGILRKKRTKRLVTRKRKSPLCPSEKVFDISDDPKSCKDDNVEAVKQTQRQRTDDIVQDTSAMLVPRTPFGLRSGNSASFDHLLTANISSHGSRHLDPPSVNTRAAGLSSVPKDKSITLGPTSCTKLLNSKVTPAYRMTLWDFPAPSFSLGIDFDDDLPSPNE